MKILNFSNLSPVEQAALCVRTAETYTDLEPTVRSILDAVKQDGDAALFNLTKRFDKVDLRRLFVSEETIDAAAEAVSPEIKNAIAIAAKNIERFHVPQVPRSYEVETAPGVICRREWRPIKRVGLYIPGGTAPLISTVLMLGIPARLAKSPEIILCTPPGPDGNVAPAILYAANLLGIRTIATIGGAQAIAAMALGTESITPVEKIFGPGNRYVAATKSIVAQPPYNVAIDVFAGPTEVLVIADESINPSWVAADLIAQAEHGPDSHILLVTTGQDFAHRVNEQIQLQLETLPRKEHAQKAMEHGAIVQVRNVEDAIEFSNQYAPEHLILAVENADSYLSRIRNAGSVFVGRLMSAVFGDYSSGTNHTLPTSGAARVAGGVTVESFMKPISFQSMSEQGYCEIAPVAATLARAESLEGHARAVDIRRKK